MAASVLCCAYVQVSERESKRVREKERVHLCCHICVLARATVWVLHREGVRRRVSEQQEVYGGKWALPA